MEEIEKEAFINQVKAIAPKHCDVCGTKYTDEDFSNIKSNNQQTVVHLRCRNCGNAYILNIYSPVPGIIGSARSQVNLDLTDTNELMTFAGSKSVTADDALDAMNLLTKSPALLDFFYNFGNKKQAQEKSKIISSH